MKQLNRVVKIISVLIFMMFIININQVKAVLQSNPRTNAEGATSNSWWWINAIRQMETRNQGMGLEEDLNGNLTSASGSNNIDVHMMKSTEYGTVAILSASTYGRVEKTQAITTTTGNATGVYINQNNWEYVAGGWKYYGDIGNFSGIANTYYVNYGGSIAGDALSGFNGWHGSSDSTWINVRYNQTHYVHEMYDSFVRGRYGLFSYDYGVYTRDDGGWNFQTGGRNWNSYARGAVVTADGI